MLCGQIQYHFMLNLVWIFVTRSVCIWDTNVQHSLDTAPLTSHTNSVKLAKFGLRICFKYNFLYTVFSLKYQTAKNNSKWECPANFRELLNWSVGCAVESFIAPISSRFTMFNCCRLLCVLVRTQQRHLLSIYLSKRGIVVTVASIVKKTTYWGCFNVDKQNHNSNNGGTEVLGLPKYQSCALLSTKDGTHGTQQISFDCKQMTIHFRRTYHLLK